MNIHFSKVRLGLYWLLSMLVPLAVQAAGETGTSAKLKKGVCLTSKIESWKSKVEALHAGWHYSWGPNLPLEEVAGVEFVPMVWGYHGNQEKLGKTLSELSAAKAAGTRKHLLGFNEPDGQKQANMTVAQAMEAWPALMKTGLRLGSPAAVHADQEWMKDFMKQAGEKKYRVDFVCVHWYGGTNVKGLLNKLRQIHELYGKPIWITEFAVADWKAQSREKNQYTAEAVKTFMTAVLPELDRLDFVERYAWFSADTSDKALGPSALFEKDGSLTPLGRVYAAHGAGAGKGSASCGGPGK